MADESVLTLVLGNRALSLQADEEKSESQDPLKTLMAAILMRAIEDFQTNGHLRREAARYLFHADRKDPADYLFSISSICDCLQIDLSELRAKILQMNGRLKIRRRVA